VTDTPERLKVPHRCITCAHYHPHNDGKGWGDCVADMPPWMNDLIDRVFPDDEIPNMFTHEGSTCALHRERSQP
jgi:hypothetical protein